MEAPNFILPKSMLELGFELINQTERLLVYRNNATIHYNTDYNKQYPESKGKVILYFVLDYSDKLYLELKQDGGTRTSYRGICPDKDFLIKLLYNNR